MRTKTIAGATVALAAIAAVLAGAAGQEEGVIVLGDVAFPHELHYLDLELDCVTCHHETNAARLDIPHEAYSPDSLTNCKRCHRDVADAATIQSCGNCHHDSPTDIADETLSAKVVVHRSCWSCHEVGTGASATRSCKNCHSGKNQTSPARKTNGERR
jgi:hypothetical protein